MEKQKECPFCKRKINLGLYKIHTGACLINSIPEKDRLKAEEAFNILLENYNKTAVEGIFTASNRYFIETFYDNDPYLAYIKNKAEELPPSLRLLVIKIKEEAEISNNKTPSVSWFYKIVSLTAHEMIFEKLCLTTFSKLGHSHKLQLLNVPRIKHIPKNKIDKFVIEAFKEKHKLSLIAVEKNLSVREFKEYITTMHGDNQTYELSTMEHQALLDYKRRMVKAIDNLQDSIKRKKETINRIERALKARQP